MGKIQRMAAEKTLAILGGGETVKGTLINTPTLETGRLILRKFTERDLEWLFLILHDKEVNQFLPWYPIDSIEEAKKFYEERYASKYVQPQAYAYAICLKTDDRLHKSGYGGTSRFRIWASQGILASGTCHRSGQSGDRPSEKGRPALYHSNA